MPIYFYIAQRYSSGTLFLITGASPLGGSEENQLTFWHLNSQQCVTFFCGYRSCAFPNCQFQQLVVTCLNWNFVHDNTGNTPLILTVPNLRPNYVIFTPQFQAWTFSFFNLTHLFGILNFRVFFLSYTWLQTELYSTVSPARKDELAYRGGQRKIQSTLTFTWKKKEGKEKNVNETTFEINLFFMPPSLIYLV